jgi:hypothetical protein
MFEHVRSRESDETCGKSGIPFISLNQAIHLTDSFFLNNLVFLLLLQQLYSRVKSHSSSVWASTLLLQLLQCLRSDQTKESVKLLDEEDMVKKYKQANKRLLLFDYDVCS